MTTSSPASCSTGPGTTCCPSPAPPPSPSASPAVTSSPPSTVRHLGEWIAHRLAFVARHGAAPAGPRGRRDLADTARRRAAATGPVRGPRSAGPSRSSRRSGNAPADLQEELFEKVRNLPGVDVGPSRISVPGARGFTLREGSDDEQAYLVPRSGSSPTCTRLRRVAAPDPATGPGRRRIDQGLGPTPHVGRNLLSPGFMMVYGPRDENELATVLGIVTASHTYAIGREALAH